MISRKLLKLKLVSNINLKSSIYLSKRHNHSQINRQLKLQNCLSYWKNVDHLQTSKINIQSNFNNENTITQSNFFMPPESQKESFLSSAPPIIRWKPEVTIAQTNKKNKDFEEMCIQNDTRTISVSKENLEVPKIPYQPLEFFPYGNIESTHYKYSKDLNEIPNLVQGDPSSNIDRDKMRGLDQFSNYKSALISFSTNVLEMSAKSLKLFQEEFQKKFLVIIKSWNFMDYTNKYSLNELAKTIIRIPEIKITYRKFEDKLSECKPILPSLENLKLSKDSYMAQIDRKMIHTEKFTSKGDSSNILNMANIKGETNDYYYEMNSSILPSSYSEISDKNSKPKIRSDNLHPKGRDIAYMICNKGEADKDEENLNKKLVDLEIEVSNNKNLSKPIASESINEHLSNISLRNSPYEKMYITDQTIDDNTNLITRNELTCDKLSFPKIDDHTRNYCKDIPIELLLSNLEATIRCHGELNSELSKIQSIYKELLSKKQYRNNEKSYEQIRKRLRNWQLLTAVFSGLTFTCGFFYIDIGEYLGYYNQTSDKN